MMILTDTILKDRYDGIVVGAGLGGLTAACLLFELRHLKDRHLAMEQA